MKNLGIKLALLISLCFSLFSFAERVTMYSDNYQGGISSYTADIILKDGQLYLSAPDLFYGDLKIYKIKEDPILLLNQPKWASSYNYVARPGDSPYYFNMQTRWIPSLTDDTPTDEKEVPVKKIKIYGVDENGDRTTRDAVVIKYRNRFYIITSQYSPKLKLEYNKLPLPTGAPSWAKNYKYKAYSDYGYYYFN